MLLLFFILTGYSKADKPQEFESRVLISRQTANLSSKKIASWEYASSQSRTGIVHFFEISLYQKAYNDVRDSEDIGDIFKVIRLERQIYVDILFAYYDECVLLFCRSMGSSVEAQLNKWTNQKAVSTAEFIRQRAKKEIDIDLIELIINEQFRFYRQVLQKGYDKEKTVRLMDSVEEFHESGWKGFFEKI